MKIARIWETDIRIGLSLQLVLLFAVVCDSGYYIDGETDRCVGLLYCAAVYLSVAVHELAHLYVARRVYRHAVDELRIHALGGAVALSDINSLPSGDVAAICCAGPLSSLALGMFALVVATLGVRSAIFVADFNVCLAALNMLPVFPMDGGRICNSLVEMTTNKTRLRRPLIVSISSVTGLSCVAIFIWRHEWIMAALVAFIATVGAALKCLCEENQAGEPPAGEA